MRIAFSGMHFGRGVSFSRLCLAAARLSHAFHCQSNTFPRLNADFSSAILSGTKCLQENSNFSRGSAGARSLRRAPPNIGPHRCFSWQYSTEFASFFQIQSLDTLRLLWGCGRRPRRLSAHETQLRDFGSGSVPWSLVVEGRLASLFVKG